MEKKKLANKILESIQAPSLTMGSDFFSPQEMTAFKKTKKKVSLTLIEDLEFHII